MEWTREIGDGNGLDMEGLAGHGAEMLLEASKSLGMEVASGRPLTTPFLLPQRVHSSPGQARPGARGGRGAGAGRSPPHPPPAVPEQPHTPEPRPRHHAPGAAVPGLAHQPRARPATPLPGLPPCRHRLPCVRLGHHHQPPRYAATQGPQVSPSADTQRRQEGRLQGSCIRQNGFMFM